MIFPAIDFIRQQLVNKGLQAGIGNISEIISDAANNPANATVIISLINIEEDRISRDNKNFIRRDGGIIYKNPAVHLNLTLLFTSYRSTAAYGLSLQDIQNVVSAFQQQYVFEQTSEPALAAAGIEKLILEMVSLNLQQLHEIWSVLGSKYYPSVVYRMRMVVIDTIPDLKGPMIEEIRTDYSKI
ncbi:MAG: DUF4255 domain-containing protein [Chitinophagaceae bacterium]